MDYISSWPWQQDNTVDAISYLGQAFITEGRLLWSLGLVCQFSADSGGSFTVILSLIYMLYRTAQIYILWHLRGGQILSADIYTDFDIDVES